MEINISDERIIKRLNQLADQLDQTPEQIVAEAIEQFRPAEPVDAQTFWNAIRGIGDSGDPDLAHNVKAIVRSEVDPIEGWGQGRGTESTDRQ